MQLLIDPQRHDRHRGDGAKESWSDDSDLQPATGGLADEESHQCNRRERREDEDPRVVPVGAAHVATRRRPDRACHPAQRIHDAEMVQRSMEIKRWQSEDRERRSCGDQPAPPA